MTVKEMKKRKLKLAHDIRNIRADYSGCHSSDIPVEVVQEINVLMNELKQLREVLGNN